MKISLTIDGVDKLKDLLDMAEEQTRELMHTVEQIESVRLELQAKINQSPAATDD